MQSDCLNPYSLSKFQGEQVCKMYSQLWELNTVILRYFNVYGPREPLRGVYAPVVGIFKRQRDTNEKLTIIGDGEQRRDFTYVKDIVNANWLAATSDVKHDIFNIGTGKNYSINQVADLVTGEKQYIKPRPAEARETLANISKAKRLLNYSPRYSLEDMINAY
jgi:UDP-glucose 4-epimerase